MTIWCIAQNWRETFPPSPGFLGLCPHSTEHPDKARLSTTSALYEIRINELHAKVLSKPRLVTVLCVGVGWVVIAFSIYWNSQVYYLACYERSGLTGAEMQGQQGVKVFNECQQENAYQSKRRNDPVVWAGQFHCILHIWLKVKKLFNQSINK